MENGYDYSFLVNKVITDEYVKKKKQNLHNIKKKEKWNILIITWVNGSFVKWLNNFTIT